jgi:hypothetical protein
MDMGRKDLDAQWKVLLGEFIHLLGLFWVHSCTARAARATDVLFNQLLQHLNILGKMPGHDGSILLRRAHCRAEATRFDTDFIVLFGNLMINSKQDISEVQSAAPHRQFAHLKSALERSFHYFAEQDIHSLLLRLPDHSAEKIERLRFSMNVLARYGTAAKDGSAIALRYYGRTVSLPLISDPDGRPDPNLTLMAALNGLSAVNTRELIKQSQAFRQINLEKTGSSAASHPQSSWYDQIFEVRSLRSQIIKPPVEINNRFCPYNECAHDKSAVCHPDLAANLDSTPGSARDSIVHNTLPAPFPGGDQSGDSGPIGIRTALGALLDTREPGTAAAIDDIFANDYESLNPMRLGQRLVSFSSLLFRLDKQPQAPTAVDRILEHLQGRLKGVSDQVLANIICQRQGLKIVSPSGAVLVGLVHPRLFDLITLVKEHVIAHQRIAMIKEIAFNVDPCHINTLADGFGVTVAEAHQIVQLLSGCFGTNGSFIRPTFESRVAAMSRHENVIFEILWCFLKQTVSRKDRLDFLNAIQLLMARLNDPKRALQFLLADICQNPSQVDFTDRNAFALANILLHKENKELYVDVNRTPEDVLRIQRPLNQQVRHYAVWRLEADRSRFLAKSRTIAETARKVLLTAAGDDPGPFEFRFLAALEREALIFAALVQGPTARVVLREALNRYGRAEAAIYRSELTRRFLPQLIPHLQVVVRALGRGGNFEDLARLQELERNTAGFCELDPHPAHGLRVRQMMRWVPEAVKTIHSRDEQVSLK